MLARLTAALGLGMRPQMHVGGVEPYEEGLAGVVLALDEILSGSHEVVVAGLHALAGEGPGVLDRVLADATPARLLGLVVLIGRLAAQHAARPEPLLEFRILRIVLVLRVLLGVEVLA